VPIDNTAAVALSQSQQILMFGSRRAPLAIYPPVVASGVDPVASKVSTSSPAAPGDFKTREISVRRAAEDGAD
jgi:hypothetical protein